MTARPTETAVRAHEMGIYKRYFDLIASGCKTTEVRVNDSSRKKIKKGSLIRFRCQGEQVLTRVTRVTRYTTFDEMFEHPPDLPPEREALGVVAIGIELVDSPRTA